MKIYTQSYTSILIITVLLLVGTNPVHAQLTPKQQTDLINRTDSIVKLYNDYGTFVEDFGYCSSNASRRYAELFREGALLFDDLDKQNHSLTSGLTVQGYIIKARELFPNCFTKSEFRIDSRDVPVKNADGYKQRLTGEKHVMAYSDDNYYQNKFTNFELVVAFSNNLTDFRIESTSIKGIRISPPVPPVNIELLVLGPDGKFLDNVSVSLNLDGVDFEKKRTDERGMVRFENLPPKTKKATLEAVSLENPEIRSNETVDFNQLKEYVIQLKEEKPVSIKVVVKDGKTGQQLRDALVIFTYEGQSNKGTIDSDGSYVIGLISGTKNIVISVHAEGYTDESVKVDKLTQNAHKTVILKKQPVPQYLVAGIASGLLMMSNAMPTAGATSRVILKGKPWVGINIGYEIFPGQIKLGPVTLGYFAQLSFLQQQFNLSSKGADFSIHSFTDPDGDTCTLNISSQGAIHEDHTVLNVALSGGLAFAYNIQPKIQLHATFGPTIHFLASRSSIINPVQLNIVGQYSEAYYYTQFTNFNRYGFKSVETNELTIENPLKGLGIGAMLKVGVSYSLNSSLSATFDLFYSGIWTNILNDNGNKSISTLSYSNTTPNPDHIYQYYGLLNTYDSFRWSNIGLQLGIRYTLK